MSPGRLCSIAAAIALAAVIVPAHGATIQISMENLEVSPAEAMAKVGDSIEWINKDAFAHTATARNGDFDVNIPPNQTATFTSKKAGIVSYIAAIIPT
jgi:plastocyanin